MIFSLPPQLKLVVIGYCLFWFYFIIIIIFYFNPVKVMFQLFDLRKEQAYVIKLCRSSGSHCWGGGRGETMIYLILIFLTLTN